MKGILCVSLLILLMPSVACAAALPGDGGAGKRLHDANCMGCHDTDSLGLWMRCKSGWATAVTWQKKNSPRLRRRTSSST